jgi:cell wall assembly regulator SMI1
MAVGYQRQEPPASPELVARLEERIGQALPPEYRNYLLAQDGGRLDNNNLSVNTIFGLGDVPDWASLWGVLDTYRDRVPGWLLPVADDDGGNLYAVSLRAEDFGSVWFWDHEGEPEYEDDPATEDNIELVVSGWVRFLEGLQPTG